MRWSRSLLLLGAVCVVVVAVGVRPPAARAASAEVAALQVALRAKGLYRSGVDGVTGPLTRRAVIRFQRRAHLTTDGIAGPRTRRKLGRRGRPRLGSRPMRRGQRGWDVAALQYLLRARGFAPGSLDGGFGATTRAAVQRFQRAAGLATDDVAGSRTLAALRRRMVSAGIADPVRFLRPVAGPITDGFGRVSGRRHTGLDFPLAMGAPVTAAGRGVVSYAGYNAHGYGNLVVVTHRLGFESWYAHLSSIAVSSRQAVVGGTLIGAAGSTGRSTGPHLHFEVRRYGTPINPVPRLLGAATRARTATVRPLVCRPNADARRTPDTDPFQARVDRCP